MADELKSVIIGTINGIVPPCPICGNRDWAKVAPHDLKEGERFEEMVIGVREENQMVGMPVITFVCNVCGFVRQHGKGTYKP
jgi:hypothetical protein